MDSVIYARNDDDTRKAKELGGKKDEDDGEGTYNPKNAWMFVDSRRRVLPDIDVEAHFASVENNILSDIHNYHMVGQTSVTEEDEYENTEDSYYAESTNTVQSVRVEDRQLSTVG